MLPNSVFLFLIVIGASSMLNAFTLPKQFVLCHRSDPDFDKCLSRAVPTSIQGIASGNKELGVPVLDNMKVPSINIEGNGGPNSLVQHYSDCIVSGPTDSTFSNVETLFEKDNCYIRMKSFSNALTATCQYNFKGNLFLLPVNGHGLSNMTLANMYGWHNITCEFYEKGGEEYLNITDWKEDFAPEKIFFYFDNLVDGNAEMSARVLQIMNDNAMEMHKNLRTDFERCFAVIYKQLANIVFSQIPWKNLFLE